MVHHALVSHDVSCIIHYDLCSHIIYHYGDIWVLYCITRIHEVQERAEAESNAVIVDVPFLSLPPCAFG